MRRPRAQASILVALIASAALVGLDLSRSGRADNAQAQTPLVAATSAAPVEPVELTPAPTPVETSAPPVIVHAGPGTFEYAAGRDAIMGTAGAVQRYRVAVEDGIGVLPEEFAAEVDRLLADPRSWIGGEQVRFERVGPEDGAAFTIYLATPVTSERMCREDWLETEQFTNCRLGSGKVIINLARWLTAVPDYGAPIDVYRAYAINHEVGHQLGNGHEVCPGPGQPAPVMQQQTYGLQGCVANGWPYLEGERYHGPGASQ